MNCSVTAGVKNVAADSVDGNGDWKLYVSMKVGGI
jgi:hypothetical protein